MGEDATALLRELAPSDPVLRSAFLSRARRELAILHKGDAIFFAQVRLGQASFVRARSALNRFPVYLTKVARIHKATGFT
jgi:hypothetical protein